MAHASPLADTTNRCERCNAPFLVSRVMLNSGTWSIIFCVYISPRYRVKSKNFLWVFWLLQLQMRPWHRKEVISELCWQTSPSVSCFQLIVRHEFPKDRVHSEGSDLISNGSLHTHTLTQQKREFHGWFNSLRTVFYQREVHWIEFSTMRAVTVLGGRKMQKLTKQSHVKFLFSHSQSYFGQKTNGGQKRTKNASQLKWLIGPSPGVKWRKHYVAKISLAAPISSELH